MNINSLYNCLYNYYGKGFRGWGSQVLPLQKKVGEGGGGGGGTATFEVVSPHGT